MNTVSDFQYTIADKIIEFYNSLNFTGKLPEGIGIMNPIREDPEAEEISSVFYKKYYNDFTSRYLILGINPGRLGGGVTGIPFTDPKRLSSECGIPYRGTFTHEPSSVFVYEMINKYGGVSEFYKKFYIGATCPLGFKSLSARGKDVNVNYYDSKALTLSVHNFIINSLKKQLLIGLRTDVCFCMGTGKNFQYLSIINKEHNFFKKIIPLEHPRFIMQYKLKSKEAYIQKYLEAFESL